MADITTASVTPIASAIKADVAAEEFKIVAYVKKVLPYATAIVGAVVGFIVAKVV